MKKVFLILIALILFLWALQKVESYDFFWHLAQGEYALKHHSPLKSDIFSYTHAGEKIKYYEVISDTIFALIYKMGGYSGISFFAAFIVLILFLAHLYFLKKKDNNIYLSSSVILFFLVLASPRISARPEIFSFFLLSILLFILHFWRREKPYLGLFIVPLQLLWANTHMGGSICFYLLILFGFAKITEKIYKRTNLATKEELRSGFIYILVLILSFSAGCLNPNGIEFFFSPFLVTGGAMTHISEWAPLNFKAVRIFYPLYAIGVLTALSSIYFYIKEEGDIFVPLSLLLFLFMSVKGVRYSSYLFIVAIIPVSITLNYLSKNIFVKFKFINVTIPASIFLLFAFMNAMLQGYRSITPGFGLKKSVYPVGAVEYIKANNLKGKLFHPLEYGGFLIHELFPDCKVFIDGRTYTLYDSSFYGLHRKASTQRGWEIIKKSYKPDIVVLPLNVPGLKNFPIVGDSSYSKVYSDANDVVWLSKEEYPKFNRK